MRQEVVVVSLVDGVKNADPDVALVQVVPEVRKVFHGALLVQLHAVVDHRVNQADQHDPAQAHSVFEVAVVVNFIHVDPEHAEVHEVDESSQVVQVLAEVVPQKLEVVLHNFRLEHLEFFCFSQRVKQVTNV